MSTYATQTLFKETHFFQALHYLQLTEQINKEQKTFLKDSLISDNYEIKDIINTSDLNSLPALLLNFAQVQEKKNNRIKQEKQRNSNFLKNNQIQQQTQEQEDLDESQIKEFQQEGRKRAQTSISKNKKSLFRFGEQSSQNHIEIDESEDKSNSNTLSPIEKSQYDMQQKRKIIRRRPFEKLSINLSPERNNKLRERNSTTISAVSFKQTMISEFEEQEQGYNMVIDNTQAHPSIFKKHTM